VVGAVVAGAVVDMVVDTQHTLADLPSMVRLSLAIRMPTATADLVTIDLITADLVMMVMNSPADTAYSTAVLDTSTVDTLWRIQYTAADQAIAADPNGHRISRTIV
jgi:hypothetical protein